MLDTALYLSHWDASIPVCIPGNIRKDLRNYHVTGVRFLYDCFRKGHKGAILNHESDMKFEIQISAFLNALNNFITPQSPVLIVHFEENVNAWHYHLTNHGGYNVTLLSLHNYEKILQGKVHRVILSTVDNVKLLREIKETDFFAVVVDQLDQVVTKNVVKQLKSQFNIGLTSRNFVKHPDQKLFWNMLNWSNPGVGKKFAEFCSEDNDHLENLRYPYGSWWQRLTWSFCDSFKPLREEERKDYKIVLQKWSRQHSGYPTDIPKSDAKKRKRKVVSNQETDTNNEEDLLSKSSRQPKAARKNTKNLPKSVKSPSPAKLNKQNSCQSDSSQEAIADVADDVDKLNSSEETVVYDFDDEDDNAILTSIIGSSDTSKKSQLSLEAIDRNVKEKKQSSKDVLSMLCDESKDDTDMDSDDDVLSSIIKTKPTQIVTNQSFLKNSSDSNTPQNSENDSSRKNEILSILFGNED